MIRRENAQVGMADTLTWMPATGNKTLEKIDESIDWTSIRRQIEKLYRKGGPGRPAFPALTLFKALLLQSWYDLSDPAAEEAIADRLSFRRFLGLTLDEKVPDHSTLHRFRDRIALIVDKLFALLNQQLDAKGLILKKGTLVDASLIHSAAHPPAKKGEGSHDADATWGGPHHKSIYGYKGHVGMDQDSELIRQAEMTTARVHDTNLLTSMVSGDEAAVYADKAYRSKGHSQWLQARGIRDWIMLQAQHPHPLSEAELEHNRLASRVRQGVERFFGTMKRHYKFRRCRYWQLSRNRCHFFVLCICYNLKRSVKLATI